MLVAMAQDISAYNTADGTSLSSLGICEVNLAPVWLPSSPIAYNGYGVSSLPTTNVAPAQSPDHPFFLRKGYAKHDWITPIRESILPHRAYTCV